MWSLTRFSQARAQTAAKMSQDGRARSSSSRIDCGPLSSSATAILKSVRERHIVSSIRPDQARVGKEGLTPDIGCVPFKQAQSVALQRVCEASVLVIAALGSSFARLEEETAVQSVQHHSAQRDARALYFGTRLIVDGTDRRLEGGLLKGVAEKLAVYGNCDLAFAADEKPGRGSVTKLSGTHDPLLCTLLITEGVVDLSDCGCASPCHHAAPTEPMCHWRRGRQASRPGFRYCSHDSGSTSKNDLPPPEILPTPRVRYIVQGDCAKDMAVAFDGDCRGNCPDHSAERAGTTSRFYSAERGIISAGQAVLPALPLTLPQCAEASRASGSPPPVRCR